MIRWPSVMFLVMALLVVAMLVGAAATGEVPVGKAAPELAGGAWINSEPLTVQKLRGRVVLVDFWTYG